MQLGTRVVRDGEWSITHVVGDVDMASVPALRAAVLEQLDDGWTRLVLDLTGADFIDSSGVGAIVGLLRRIERVDGRLELVVPLSEQRRVFEACRLDRIFSLHADLPSAMVDGPGDGAWMAPQAAMAADGESS